MLRKIPPVSVAIFLALFALVLLLSIVTNSVSFGRLELGEFRGVVLTISFVALFYLFNFAAYRLFVTMRPLPVGDIVEGSFDEIVLQIHNLFFVIIFFSVIKTGLVPVPIMRILYRALGAKIGGNTYGGVLLDPPLTEIGENCLLGHNAVCFCHVFEGRDMALHPVVIGDNVTIGANAVVMPGVTIESGAMIAVGAVVTKGTHIPGGQIWGGIPARPLGGHDGGVS